MRLNANGPFPAGEHLNGLYVPKHGWPHRFWNYASCKLPGSSPSPPPQKNEGYLEMLAKLFPSVLFIGQTCVSAKEGLAIELFQGFEPGHTFGPDHGFTSDIDVDA